MAGPAAAASERRPVRTGRDGQDSAERSICEAVRGHIVVCVLAERQGRKYTEGRPGGIDGAVGGESCTSKRDRRAGGSADGGAGTIVVVTARQRPVASGI
jgi:hypothetical protein